MRLFSRLMAIGMFALISMGATCSGDSSSPSATITLLNSLLDEEALAYNALQTEHGRNSSIENQNWEAFSTSVVLWDEAFAEIPAQFEELSDQLAVSDQAGRDAVAGELVDLRIRMDSLLARIVRLTFLAEPWTESYLRNANLHVAINLNRITTAFSGVFGQPPSQAPSWSILVTADARPPKIPLVKRAWNITKSNPASCDPAQPCTVNPGELFAIKSWEGYFHYESQTFGINLGTISNPEFSVRFRRKGSSATQGPIRYGERVAVGFLSSDGNEHAIIHESATDGSVDLGFTTSVLSDNAYQWELVPIWSYLSNGEPFDSRQTFALKNLVKSSSPYLTRCYVGFSVGVDLGWFTGSPTEINNFTCED